MPDTKEHLANAIDSIRNGDNEAAQKSFSEYTTQKTQEILHPEEIEVDNSDDKVG